MADQDELVQVGSETIIEESVAQDDSFEGDQSLQSYPEGNIGGNRDSDNAWAPPASNFPHGGPSDPYRIHTRSWQIDLAKAFGHEPVDGVDENDGTHGTDRKQTDETNDGMHGLEYANTKGGYANAEGGSGGNKGGAAELERRAGRGKGRNEKCGPEFYK